MRLPPLATDVAVGKLEVERKKGTDLMDVEMRMPALGAVDDTVKILKWLVDVGQMIERGQPLVEVETDKSIMELESAVTGLLHSIRVPAGR